MLKGLPQVNILKAASDTMQYLCKSMKIRLMDKCQTEPGKSF